jgi:hypothetical protein
MAEDGARASVSGSVGESSVVQVEMRIRPSRSNGERFIGASCFQTNAKNAAGRLPAPLGSIGRRDLLVDGLRIAMKESIRKETLGVGSGSVSLGTKKSGPPR